MYAFRIDYPAPFHRKHYAILRDQVEQAGANRTIRWHADGNLAATLKQLENYARNLLD